MSRIDLDVLFDRERPRLRSVAHRLLNSSADAEDAVQEAWLRLTRTDTAELENLSAWLTTVVARIALDTVRKRERDDRLATRRIVDPPVHDDPAADVELNDAVGSALMLVLQELSPPERFAFVLHDVFGVPFADLGEILDRSTAATKQLASRARNKVRGKAPCSAAELAEQRRVVDAFLAAARNGDFDELIRLLHPEAKLELDAGALRMGAATAAGAPAVAGVFAGRALAAQPALVGGAVGIAWIVQDAPRVAWNLFIDGGTILHIEMAGGPARLVQLQVETLDPPSTEQGRAE